MLPALLAAIRSVPWSLRRATAGHGSELGGAVASCRAEPVELAPRAPAQPAIAHGRGQLPGAQRSDTATEILSAGEFERCIERERCRADRGKRCFSMVVLRPREDAGTTRLEGAALNGFARQLRRRLRSTDIVGHVGSARLEVLLTDTETKGAQVVIAWAKQAGYEKLQTANEVRNEPIRRLNARHGYELQPGLVTLTDSLSGPD